MFGPGLSRIGRVFDPAYFSAEIRAGHDVHFAITVDIERGVGKILVVLRIRTGRDVADFVLGPIRPGVPRIAAEDIRFPVAIEIGHTDRLEWRAVVDRMLLPWGRLRREQHLRSTGADREAHKQDGEGSQGA